MPSTPFPRSPGRLGAPGDHPGPVRDGGWAAVPPGLAVRVGGVDQTAYLRYGSLSLRLASFDFGLVAPAVAPAVGDLVFLQEPAWDGQVVSVAQTDPDAGSTTFYAVTASNAKVAVASPAPFGLSDHPDNATTFGYRGMKLTRSATDTGPTVRGSCTIYQAGIWPGMTIAITSANFGLVAAQFTVSNVTVTWPSGEPVYALEFGDAMVTLSAWAAGTAALAPDGSISGTKITDGSVTTPKLAANAVIANVANVGGTVTIDSTGIAITQGKLSFLDTYGSTGLTGAGFGAAWRRFIARGLYNCDFYATPPTPGSDIDNASNALPFWTFAKSSGTAITARSVADAGSASGRVLRLSMAAGAAGDDSYIEQIAAINSSRLRDYAYLPYMSVLTAASPTAAVVYITCQYLKADGLTATGSAATIGYSTTSIGASTTYQIPCVGFGTLGHPPADAYYLRVRVGFKRDVAAVGATDTVDILDIRLIGGDSAVVIADRTAPATYGFGRIKQDAANLQIIANSYHTGAGQSEPMLSLDGSGSRAKVTTIGDLYLTQQQLGSSGSPGTQYLQSGYLYVPAGGTVYIADADLPVCGMALIRPRGNDGFAICQFYRLGTYNETVGIDCGGNFGFQGTTFAAGGTNYSVFLESNGANARLAVKSNVGFDRDMDLIIF